LRHARRNQTQDRGQQKRTSHGDASTGKKIRGKEKRGQFLSHFADEKEEIAGSLRRNLETHKRLEPFVHIVFVITQE
jgi:hypothetical protein